MVVLVTGSGLKDPSSLEKKIEVVDIEASGDAVGEYVDGQGQDKA